MSSLTINQEKQIRAARKSQPLEDCFIPKLFRRPSGQQALGPTDDPRYVELAQAVREWRGLKAAANTLEVREKRMALLKEIDRCLEALEEK